MKNNRTLWSIVRDFHHNSKKLSDEENKRIIRETVAKLIENDIDSLAKSKDSYPSNAEFACEPLISSVKSV